MVKKAVFGRKLDKDIDIAVRASFSARHATENPHVGGAITSGNFQNLCPFIPDDVYDTQATLRRLRHHLVPPFYLPSTYRSMASPAPSSSFVATTASA